jgi:hypothetical protein
MPSSGVWRRVDVVDWTDVSEDRIASIFRVEKSASEVAARSKVWTVFASSNAGIVGLNARITCVYFVFVLFCV